MSILIHIQILIVNNNYLNSLPGGEIRLIYNCYIIRIGFILAGIEGDA
jgi:hypothetical protein